MNILIMIHHYHKYIIFVAILFLSYHILPDTNIYYHFFEISYFVQIQAVVSNILYSHFINNSTPFSNIFYVSQINQRKDILLFGNLI